MKRSHIIIIIFLIAVGILVLLYSVSFQENSYNGGFSPNGEYCDYGYKNATKSCCDEDDYSCELCDENGIYCDTDDIVQDFQDIDFVEDKTGVGDYDCSDFASWEIAQKVFIREGGPNNDQYSLDEDGDGIACEYLRK